MVQAIGITTAGLDASLARSCHKFFLVVGDLPADDWLILATIYLFLLQPVPTLSVPNVQSKIVFRIKFQLQEQSLTKKNTENQYTSDAPDLVAQLLRSP